MVSGQCQLYAFWPSLTFRSTFGVFLICIQFILPLCILVYCYGRIVWLLHSRVQDTRSDSVNNSQNGLQMSSNKFQLARRNTVKTFLLVGICFVVCWVNNQVYFLMYNLGYEVDWNSVYYQFTVLMVFLNCTVNPFIYLAQYRDYQIALRRFFHCFGGGKQEGEFSSEFSQSTKAAVVQDVDEERTEGIPTFKMTPVSDVYI